VTSGAFCHHSKQNHVVRVT